MRGYTVALVYFNPQFFYTAFLTNVTYGKFSNEIFFFPRYLLCFVFIPRVTCVCRWTLAVLWTLSALLLLLFHRRNTLALTPTELLIQHISMELGTLTEHSSALKAFPVMILFIIYDPACLELSATQKYSVNI